MTDGGQAPRPTPSHRAVLLSPPAELCTGNVALGKLPAFSEALLTV